MDASLERTCLETAFREFRGSAVFLLASLDHKGRVFIESYRHEVWWNIGR